MWKMRTLRDSAWLAFDSLCRLRPVARRGVALVLRLDPIGDFFIWMQSGAVDISRYARSSKRRVVLLANGLWADYARGTGLWDEVIGVDPQRFVKSPLYRARILLRIRRLGAELLIQPRASRVFLQEDAIARVAGAACRIGNRGIPLNLTEHQRSRGNRWYDRLIAVEEKGSTHETIRNQQFVHGLTGGSSTPFEFARPPAEEEAAWRQTAVVVLGAGQAGRVWPAEKLAQLLTHLRRTRPSLRIVLLGIDSNRALAQRLQRLVGAALESRVGATRLGEYIDIIARARLVICNDTSAYHIAMAYRRDVLCFLGGGHYGSFAPYPVSESRGRAIVLNVPMECYWCNWQCKYAPESGGAFRCVASIPVDAAIRAVDEMLDQ